MTATRAVPQRRKGGRLAALLSGAALLGASVTTFVSLEKAVPAAADPIGQCSTTSGVIVAVEFSHWGGPLVEGCDATLTTGYDALHAAGFITAGTQEYGPAIVCRIGLASTGTSSLEPPPSEDPCVNTPPASAYWSYWHADAGQDTWTYSRQGAMSYRPPPGSVDAWVFGATNLSGTSGQPSFPPSAVMATNTTSAPTTTTSGVPTAGAAPSGPGPAAAQPNTTRGTISNSRSSATRPAPAGPATSSQSGQPPVGSGGSPASPAKPSTALPDSRANTGGSEKGQASSATAAGDQHQTRIVIAAPAAAGRSAASSGPPEAFLYGVGAIVAVGGAGGLVAWRRRRRES